MFLFLASLRAATSLSSMNTSLPQRLWDGCDGMRARDVSVLSQGGGFRVSQGPSLGRAPSSVLAAGPRFNPLPFRQRTFAGHQLPINLTGRGRFQEVETREGHSRSRAQHEQRCGCRNARAGSTSIFHVHVATVGWGGEGNSSRCSWEDWLRLRLDGPGEAFGL